MGGESSSSSSGNANNKNRSKSGIGTANTRNDPENRDNSGRNFSQGRGGSLLTRELPSFIKRPEFNPLLLNPIDSPSTGRTTNLNRRRFSSLLTMGLAPTAGKTLLGQ